MKRCIFCGSTTNTYERKEHIVPESLGGKDILPEGLVCDNCNNYFGREFEKETLDFEDIKFSRALERIPSKRGRTPVANVKKVTIYSDRNTKPIKIYSPQMTKTISGKGSIHIEFPQSKLGPLLRLLLKIGLEYFAIEQADDIFEQKFNKAKKVVRCPARGCKWPLAIKTRSGGSSELYSHKFHRIHENDSVIFEFSYWLTCCLIPLDDDYFEKFRLEIGDSEYNVLNVGIL